jgi:uncharacterized membrane protein (DUF485 family)
MLDPAIDWEAVAASDAFRALVRRRRRVAGAAVGAVMLFYGGFVLLSGLQVGVLGDRLVGPFTVVHLWAAAQIPFAWIVAAAYLRVAREELDPMAAAVRADAMAPYASIAPGATGAPAAEVLA